MNDTVKKHRPNVGIGIFMFNTLNQKFLIGKRKKENKFGLPGGALEFFESFEECACRELYEETGVKITDTSRVKYIACFNCFKKEDNYHWVDVYMRIHLENGDEENSVINMEPDKCYDWIWVDYEECMTMWENLFLPLQEFIIKYKIKSTEDIINLK